MNTLIFTICCAVIFVAAVIAFIVVVKRDAKKQRARTAARLARQAKEDREWDASMAKLSEANASLNKSLREAAVAAGRLRK